MDIILHAAVGTLRLLQAIFQILQAALVSAIRIITSPPQLAKFCLGPAQLSLKVQDFALGCSFLGECLFLGLLHLHTKYRGKEG